MSELISILISVAGAAFNFLTRNKNIADWLIGKKEMPVRVGVIGSQPPAIVVNFSQNAVPDATKHGFNVLGELGVPKHLSPSEITHWSESAAAVISKLRRITGETPLTLILACPVSAAFIIGILLGHSTEYQIVHWDKNKYHILKQPDLNRFRQSL